MLSCKCFHPLMASRLPPSSLTSNQALQGWYLFKDCLELFKDNAFCPNHFYQASVRKFVTPNSQFFHCLANYRRINYNFRQFTILQTCFFITFIFPPHKLSQENISIFPFVFLPFCFCSIFSLKICLIIDVDSTFYMLIILYLFSQIKYLKPFLLKHLLKKAFNNILQKIFEVLKSTFCIHT